MPQDALVKLLACLLALGLVGCGTDSGPRAADTGAGRPDTTHGAAAETPAIEVLQGTGVGGVANPGAALDTAVIDSTARVDG